MKIQLSDNSTGDAGRIPPWLCALTPSLSSAAPSCSRCPPGTSGFLCHQWLEPGNGNSSGCCHFISKSLSNLIAKTQHEAPRPQTSLLIANLYLGGQAWDSSDTPDSWPISCSLRPLRRGSQGPASQPGRGCWLGTKAILPGAKGSPECRSGLFGLGVCWG